ncbi:MAG: tyrosine-type recombinase/integrase [Mailhella sp.]|nr:tyrosine-type recombinase/integrase [Mailhella sp.]
MTAKTLSRYVRPYDLRHAFAAEAIAAGIDIGTTIRMMAHASPSMVLKRHQHVFTK